MKEKKEKTKEEEEKFNKTSVNTQQQIYCKSKYLSYNCCSQDVDLCSHHHMVFRCLADPVISNCSCPRPFS